MGDFRDGLVAGLLQAPPSDDSECADIKRVLAADLERQRLMFSKDALHFTGDYLACANSLVDDRERDLTASPGYLLTQDDMRFYACMEIQARIRQMLDADVASKRLVVRVADGKQVALLDDFVAWAILHKNITPEQPALPSCEHSLVHDACQRLRQRISAEAMAANPQMLLGTPPASPTAVVPDMEPTPHVNATLGEHPPIPPSDELLEPRQKKSAQQVARDALKVRLWVLADERAHAIRKSDTDVSLNAVCADICRDTISKANKDLMHGQKGWHTASWLKAAGRLKGWIDTQSRK